MTASITVADACARRWDVAIVGAGPAGATAALLLARQGRSVLLVERASFPREKTCGCCLNGRAVAVLRALGLGGVVDRGAQLSAVEMRLGKRRLGLAIPPGRAISRGLLDSALAQAAADAGASFLPSCSAALLPAGGASVRTLHLHCGPEAGEASASLVLACDGIGGRLLETEPLCAWHIVRDAWMGVSLTSDRVAAKGAVSPFPQGVICMHIGRGGYVGAVRLADGRPHLAAALDPAAARLHDGPGNLVRRILSGCGVALDHHQWRLSGAPLLTRHREVLGAHRVLALGDSCGYVEPFTGEGMSWAIASAVHLCSWLQPFGSALPADLATRWTAAGHQFMRREQLTCRALRYSLHRPKLAGAAFSAGRVAPGLVRMMVRRVGREDRKGF